MQALRYIPEFGRMKNNTHLSGWHPFESARQSCLFSLPVTLKWKTALPIFAQKLEETGKSRDESTDLKEPLSPNNVILINSSSAIPLLPKAVLLTSTATQSHAQLFCLAAANCVLGLPQRSVLCTPGLLPASLLVNLSRPVQSPSLL